MLFFFIIICIIPGFYTAHCLVYAVWDYSTMSYTLQNTQHSTLASNYSVTLDLVSFY